MEAELQKVTVAVSMEFLKCFGHIPRRLQTKVMSFVSKFRADPQSPGINYERIQSARDANMYSVRIDQDYRGVVYKPAGDSVYMLLWVDSHENAYRWAANRECRIHPAVGSIQIFEIPEPAKEVTPSSISDDSQESSNQALFAAIRDRELLRLGVPEALIPKVRLVCSAQDLDALEQILPPEAYEGLYYITEGMPVDLVLKEIELTRAAQAEQAVEVTDFARALQHPDSQRRFHVIADELELQRILQAPLEQWRIFLHPAQRELVEKQHNGPMRVLGGAGTGKTVVAMHRAAWLASRVFIGENDRILFTTFSKNLAEDIRANLKSICSEDAMKRIEVINIDKWVPAFLQRHGFGFTIDYGEKIKPLWEQALVYAPENINVPLTFYREEWEQVIQAQGITSVEQYFRASRVGRGVSLYRKERKAVWRVFEEYRALLDMHRLREIEDAVRDARQLLAEKGAILPYRAVIVDEAQDMSAEVFKLIRDIIPGGDQPNDLFIVGDAHQRIYRHKVVLSHCGVNVRGRSRQLRINYRTTEETRSWAVRLLEGVPFDDLDGGADLQKGYRSLLHGSAPEVRVFGAFTQELQYIVAHVDELLQQGESENSICLVARTNELLRHYSDAFNAKGIITHEIKHREAEDRHAEGIRLATMHRVKGLEFDYLIIAGVNEGYVPLELAHAQSEDITITEAHERQERALLYVAATRAKKAVLVTCFGKLSKFLIGSHEENE